MRLRTLLISPRRLIESRKFSGFPVLLQKTEIMLGDFRAVYRAEREPFGHKRLLSRSGPGVSPEGPERSGGRRSR